MHRNLRMRNNKKKNMPGKFLPTPQGQEPSKRQPFIAHLGIDEAVQEARGMTADGGSINTQLNHGLSEQLSESMAGDSQISQIISKAVDAAIKAALPQIINAVKEACFSTIKANLNPHLLRIQFKQDEMQQEMRRDNLRLTGLPESQEEETEDQLINSVKAVAKEAGVDIRSEDISACHRLGKKREGGKSRQTVVRFQSRRKRDKLYSARFNLKGKETMKGVYINEDLSAMRHALLMRAKVAPNVKSATSRYGNISCKMSNGEFKVVKSPDDLFDLGLDDIDYGDFKLHFLA